MTTVEECIQKQNTDCVLEAPSAASLIHEAVLVDNTASTTTLSIALVNNTSSSNTYAYVSGLASNNNSAVYLLER